MSINNKKKIKERNKQFSLKKLLKDNPNFKFHMFIMGLLGVIFWVVLISYLL